MHPIFRRRLAPLLLIFAPAVVAAILGYATGGGSSPIASSTQAPDSAAIIRGVVQNVGTERISLTTPSGSRSFQLAPDVVVEALAPAPPSAIRTGDWINAGAIPHRSTMFALIGLVAISQGNYEAPQ